ncbi:MAG: hypothetical protein A4S09_00590 [Proteobacteria bacterium SG_bin7]|nr:MAG: hypothetical protein A4S09_00590 [Proteobacteria bacterium SG_bin7]
MEILIDLMNRKNSFLEKFYTINEAELLNFSSDDFGNLESFYQCRENILRLIGRIDEQLDDHLKSIDTNLSREVIMQIQTCLDKKDEWAKKIVDQDLQIISAIEKKKSGIITELKSVQNTRKLNSAYTTNTSRARQKVNEKA